MRRALARPAIQGALFLAVLLCAWEAASDLGLLRAYAFPPPSRIAGAATEMIVAGFPEGLRLWTHLLVTVGRIVEGFLLAMALAVPLGLVIGRLPLLDAMTAPLVTFARSVATLSLLPLVIVWFGIGESSKVVLIAYGCFWVMLTNTIAAVKYVDPVLVRAARTMDVSGARLFLAVVLPAATPRLLAGARVALGVGFMVIVAAEMIGTIQGLGALIMEARTFYRTDISIVGMLALGLLGIAFTTGLGWLERVLIPWHGGLAGVRR